MYNYAKLLNYINSFGGVEKLSSAMNVDYRTISDKLLNKRGFNQREIEKIIAILGLKRIEIYELFFDDSIC